VRKKQRLKTREVQDRVAEQSKKAKEKKDKKKDKK